ncbi:MAG: hypothetical protein GC136_00290 [Alphaproteobacteria bacterium]|nr:hypothetical protein [Alphaproteobacteria bacterium]
MRFTKLFLCASASILLLASCATDKNSEQVNLGPAGAPQSLLPGDVPSENMGDCCADPAVGGDCCDEMVQETTVTTTKVAPPPAGMPVPPQMLSSKDVEARLSHLERRVDDIDRSVTAMKPAMLKVELFDKKLDEYAATRNMALKNMPVAVAPPPVAPPRMMQPVIDEPKAAPPPAPAPAAKKNAVKSEVPASDAAVTAVRMSDSAGKTRIVFDLTGPSKYSYDVDNDERILTVTLATAKLQSGANLAKAGALVSAMEAQPDGAGTRYIFALKNDAKVTAAQALTPSGGAGHRVFLDLQAQ